MKTFSKVPSENNYKHIGCALCGGTDSRPMWKRSEIPFARCNNCGLVYQDPQPLTEELLERYDDEYFDYEISNEESFFNLMLLGLKDIGFFNEEKKILTMAGETSGAPVFLDIGCATGRLLAYLQKRGWAVGGVEVCAPAALYGIQNRGLNIHIGTLETAGIEDSSVDVVHCSHLIEHLTQPDLFIAGAARILKPGGKLVVVTPDISGFQARLFGPEWRSAIADHMYLFSRTTLGLLMKKNGFRIEKTASWGGLAAGTAPYFLKRAADRIVKPLHAGDVVSIMGTI